MNKLLNGAVIALGIAGAPLMAAFPAAAADVVGVHVSPVGLGFSVGNGHYYDRDHRRRAYTYPSDWRTYHHPHYWYRSHPRWNDQHDSDWYRN
jgi:hypothetical protein